MYPYSIIPGLVVLGLIVVLAGLIARWTTSFRVEIANDKDNPRFYTQLEGLRGLLAVQVVLHHSVIHWLVVPRLGHWMAPPSNFYEQMGHAPVHMFFFLTGFLFWSKLMRKPKFDLVKYFAARARRLIPVYAVAMSVLFLLVALHTGFRLQVPLGNLFSTALQWILFVPLGRPDINGLQGTKELIAGVPWSLAAEWRFYLILPLLGWFAMKWHRCMYLLAASSILFAATGSGSNLSLSPLHNFFGLMVLSFGVGILVAAIKERWSSLPFASTSTASAIALMSIVVSVLMPEGLFNPRESLTLGIAFLLFVYGNDLWGFLRSGPMLMLGKASYSIYLCHGLVLSMIASLVGHFISLKSLTLASEWLLILFSTLTAVAASILCYGLVESRFIKLDAPVELRVIRIPATISPLREMKN